jgi:HK97 family phage portal protein
MGLLQFLSGRAARDAEAAKSSSAGPLFSWHALGQPRWTPRRFDKLAEEGYRRNVVAYRCIRTISTAAASAKWLLYGRRGQEFTEHRLLDLLARPNPVQGGSALLESLVGFFLISGNSYLEAAGPDQGPPRELYALRPDRMKVVPGPTGLPGGYEYSVQGRKHLFPADALSGASAILHFKAFNPLDDWYGLSPIEAAAYSIDQHNAAGVWNQALLQNSARPSGALVFSPKDGPASLSDAQFERLKAEIDEQYSGARAAGRPLLLEGGLDWKEMSLSPKDMDFLNAKLQSARDVAAAFGVPPMLVGVPGDSTYANYREARLALWEETILPLLDFIADQLNHWLSPRFGDHLKLAFDKDEISALSPRREEAWARVQGAEFLTLNEKRAAVGYAPLEGGDELPMLIAQPVEPADELDEPETVPITLPFDLARAARKKARPARFKFDPNQPRDPEGSPTGGQWTDGGGGSGGSARDDDISGGSGDDTLAGDIDADDLADAEVSNLSSDSAIDPKNPPAEWATDNVKETWGPWTGELAKLPGVTPTQQSAFGHIYAVEGGTKDHLLTDDDGNVIKDKFGNPTVLASSGINAELLKDSRFKKDFPELAKVKHPGEIPLGQRARIYQWYFDKVALRTVGGGKALDRIEDERAAIAAADVLFRGGGAGRTRIIQGAINKTLENLPAAERQRLKVPDAVTDDGAMGPQTFDAFKALANAGQGCGLINNLTKLRDKKWVREELRNNYYRFDC